MAVHITKPAQPDKTSVVVFGKHKGVLLPAGKVQPPKAENYLYVEYRDDHGTRFRGYVLRRDVSSPVE